MALVKGVAEEAGRLLLGGMATAGETVETKSSVTDVVTEMDRASEKLITSAILERRPDDAILAEEGGARAGTSGVTWVIDPLDGTVNYLYGLAPFAVSIAARSGEGTFLGVVHDPVHGETFTALAGRGAWLDGRRLRCSAVKELGLALVGTGFSYARSRRKAQAAAVAELLPHVRDIRRGGAAAVDLCWVAAGRLDAYYESGIREWDRAAGELVAREAGAHVQQVEPGPGNRPDEFLPVVTACAPLLEQPFLALLRSARANLVPTDGG
ncbi:MAG: inositol monophosphatase family protein [Actinomycetota bacterium]|nr:inositol monophosphatase family protein [Actinomycetota bacterium]